MSRFLILSLLVMVPLLYKSEYFHQSAQPQSNSVFKRPGHEVNQDGFIQLPRPSLGGQTLSSFVANDGDVLKLECGAGQQIIVDEAIYEAIDGSAKRDVTALIKALPSNVFMSDDNHAISIHVGPFGLNMDPAPGKKKRLRIKIGCMDLQPLR